MLLLLFKTSNPLNNNDMHYTAMKKNDLAKKIGVSTRTLRQWINERYYNDLKPTGYNKKQKVLTPKQVKILHDILVVTE